jgi:hypothetical protein
VGDTYNNSTGAYSPISTSAAGYGLQNSTAKGYISGSNVQYIGVVPFSGTNYWDDRVCQYTNDSWNCTGNSNLKSEYATNGASYSGEPYPYVYRSNMSSTAPTFYTSGNAKDIQNNGYTIAYYVEIYVGTLKSLGTPNTITGRLLTYEEASSLSSTIKGTWSYWLGSADSSSHVRNVTGGSAENDALWRNNSSGVRPVIEVPTSSIPN